MTHEWRTWQIIRTELMHTTHIPWQFVWSPCVHILSERVSDSTVIALHIHTFIMPVMVVFWFIAQIDPLSISAQFDFYHLSSVCWFSVNKLFPNNLIFRSLSQLAMGSIKLLTLLSAECWQERKHHAATVWHELDRIESNRSFTKFK